MKLPFSAALIAVALALLTTGAHANDGDSAAGTALVSNNHGGYNVTRPGARPISIPFFGPNGYASIVNKHSHDKPKFILVPVLEDVGHGTKITVYKRIYFATAEEAEAARLKQ